MGKTLILTDSGCDLPEGAEKDLDIDIIPFSVLIDDKEYYERVDLTPEQFYALANAAKEIPKTTQIVKDKFIEKFKEIAEKKEYSNVICILINSTGSATFNNAKAAWEEIRLECPSINVFVVDSRGYSIMYGYCVLQAAKMASLGDSPEKIISYLEEFFACCEVYILSYDLKFMKKSGRITAASAFLGELMGFRPVISLIDGVSVVEKKVRGDKAVIDEATKIIMERRTPHTPWFFVKTAIPEQEKNILSAMTKAIGEPPTLEAKLGCVVAANTGTKAIGIIIKGKNRGLRK